MPAREARETSKADVQNDRQAGFIISEADMQRPLCQFEVVVRVGETSAS